MTRFFQARPSGRRPSPIDIATVLGLLTFIAGASCFTVALATGLPALPAAVRIDNFSFGTAPLQVLAGTKVTWTNQDDIPHTVVDASGKPAFKSPPLDTGEAFSFTFDHPGTYRYFCSIHPKMQGTVTVTPAK